MNDTRFLSALNLSSKAKDALAINGYQSVQDLLGVQPQELAEELGLTLAEAQEILTSFSSTPLAPSQGVHHSLPPSSSYSISASQLLSRPQTLPIISTLSSSVDSLLLPSHGVQQGMIVEIAGGPGVGKTSALIGLAMDARRAAEGRKVKGEEGGGGEVLIVDTEGSIDVARLEQAARSVCSGSDPTSAITPSSILQGIHLTRIHTLPQFISFFMTLESFLKTNPKISLVVIDTLSHPIRSPAVPPDGKSKGRIVALIKSTLQKCSALLEVAIVTSVQLATKFVDSEGKPGNFDPDSRAILTPQLGESYMPIKTKRILLFFGGGSPTSPQIRRYATTLPSPNPNPNSNSTFSSSPFPSQHQHQRGTWAAGSGMGGTQLNGISLRAGGGGGGWGGGKSQGGEEKEDRKLWAKFEISEEGLTMTTGSTVSLVWGVQIETVPLLLGSQCYESYHQAEIFFALLSLRIRTNTFRLELNSSSSSSLLPRPSLASLPPEVTDMILDELFGTLYSDRRTALIKRLGTCCCSFERKKGGGTQDEGEHECGIECSHWPDCCSQMEDPPDTIWHREHDCTTVINSRLLFWDNRGNDSPLIQLEKSLRRFHLNLITLPTFADICYRGPTLPLSVVGLPAVSPHSSDVYLPVACEQLHQSHVEIEVEIEVEDETETTAVISLPSFRALSLEQSKSFSRFLRVTRLAQAETRKIETVGKALGRGEEEKMEAGQQEEGEEGDASRDGGGSSVQPSLLLVHRLWSW
ncbi:hypothetical protein BDY24DRAFT_439594 [Mrakia frigida]|uniref:uncharacterized protein n=1 Tax=Mrakia frigida TaxID=29902 RepID=UPI003FCC1197